jgi:hypothetical protein
VGSIKQEDHGAGWPEQKERPYLQKTRAKRVGGVVLAVEHLLSKHKVLSSNVGTAKKKQRKRKKKKVVVPKYLLCF